MWTKASVIVPLVLFIVGILLTCFFALLTVQHGSFSAGPGGELYKAKALQAYYLTLAGIVLTLGAGIWLLVSWIRHRKASVGSSMPTQD